MALLPEPWAAPNREIALVVAFISLICWGSWSNTAKAASHIPFAYYYMDYSFGVFITASAFFSSLGIMRLNNNSTTTTFEEGTTFQVAAAFGAGAVFNIGNLLLVVGIQIAGLSIAFPLAIGTALALGTVLTYVIDQSGDPFFLFSGVGVGIVAILVMTRAYHVMHTHRKQIAISGDKTGDKYATEEEKISEETSLIQTSTLEERSFLSKVIICLAAGLLMSLWNPLAAYSRQGEFALTTYTSFLFYCAAVVVTSPMLLVMQNYRILIPAVGKQTNFCGYFLIKPSGHLWGLLGGIIWAVGTLSNLVSGDAIGFANSYAMGQSAPVVATLWGLLYYKEFKNSPISVYIYLGVMFLCYGGAVALIALGGDPDESGSDNNSTNSTNITVW
eukprot:m.117969 g.117969  ORF g.117969 m.117969 type:complete len:388 (-) comp28622_c1_seq1:33-1196(-)